jgi:hypothetical protein
MERKIGRPLRTTGYALAFNAQRTRVTNDRQLSTFHLPEVCRQIYAETAILAYSTNTFALFPLDSGWVGTLSQIQRKAITRVELNDLYKYLHLFQFRYGMASLKNKGLIRLTHCHVSISEQQLAKKDLREPFLSLSNDRKSWVRLVTDAVRFQEGQHMVVEVE